ncbi:hypothetical protein [Ilumatobacter sp.]|uniref:hypothetical protein n=1 Tax=Ilumatobacter sp. TaxID=1967498 RepID=UPI003C3FC102
MTGTVVEFDAAVGLGVIAADDDRYPFHCIAISDGSRDIAIGTEVAFDVLCKFGRYEAADIRS